MRKVAIIWIMQAALMLAACGNGAENAETVVFKHPYSVETAKQWNADKEDCSEVVDNFEQSEIHLDIAEAECKAELVFEEPIKEDAKPVEDVVEGIVKDIVEDVQEHVEEPQYEDIETGEELPPPAETLEPGEYIGGYTVTWYSRESVGYDAPGASGNGLIPYYSCAMPDTGLLNCTVLVEGFGFFHVDDISPDGIVDLYVMYDSDIPACGMSYADVYVVG